MTNVLIINAHPEKESLCASIAAKYAKGATENGAIVDEIHLNSLQFNPVLTHGYNKRTELEPDLLTALEKIKDANHLVLVYPNWWGTYPAILKGFIDRLFLPGIAFKPIENSMSWEKLFKGKTARIMVTMDSPGFYYRLWLKRPGHNSMKKSILQFVGISPVKSTEFKMVKTASHKTINKWLNKAYLLGKKVA